MMQGDNGPDKTRTITRLDVQMQILDKTLSIETRLDEMTLAYQTLSQTIAVSMKQNIEMMSRINDYIGDQMSYRMYRQNLEENNIQLQLKQKILEIDFMQNKYDALVAEKKEDEAEAKNLRMEGEKLRLEVDALRKNLETLKEAKHSTKDRIPTLKVQQAEVPVTKVKETVILTAVGTITAAGVAGIIAFLVYFVRFYIQNTP